MVICENRRPKIFGVLELNRQLKSCDMSRVAGMRDIAYLHKT